MSLFPAYTFGQNKEQEDAKAEAEISVADQWLKNQSFKQFQNAILISDDEKPHKKKKSKKKKSQRSSPGSSTSRSRSRSRKKKKVKKEKNESGSRSRSTSRSRSKSKNKKKVKKEKKESRSRSRSKSKSRSRSRNKKKVKKEKKLSRSRSRSISRSRKRRSRSRKRSKSRSRSRRKSRSRETRKHRSRSRHGRKSRSRSRKRSKNRRKSKSPLKKTKRPGVNVEESEVFRIDIKADKTLKFAVGTYGYRIPSYKKKVRGVLGRTWVEIVRSRHLEDFKRFHNKGCIKKFIKTKNVVHLDKENISLTPAILQANLGLEYIKVDVDEERYKYTEDTDLPDRISGIYDDATKNYLAGVGGQSGDTENSLAEYENPQIKQRRLEFNEKLRRQPTNVELWIEFIDFQDEILKESVFDLEDDLVNKAAKKKRGEVLRAKAVTERKLAICRSAITKNSRSIELAVKRLELSRDLLDSKTLDNQWKELIFVYPENVDLWKRYLLFVQTFYIRFSVAETLKAYKNAILKLRQQQAHLADHQGTSLEAAENLFKLEHGILDILVQLVNLLIQAGHEEKGIAVCQALLEFNLHNPNFSGRGDYDFDDKVSLLEPVWEKGCPRVGEEGAVGWGVELDRLDDIDSVEKKDASLDNDWEDDILADTKHRPFAETWLDVELGREKRHWAPWTNLEEPPEDVERTVGFDFICGFLVEFSRQETKFRLLLSVLSLLGVKGVDKEFSSLKRSAAMERYFAADKLQNQNFHNQLNVLQDTIPTVRTSETLAIFIHNVFAQSYSKFPEPYRTNAILMWLEFEAGVIRQNKGGAAKELKKDLKKLIRCLLKEDRTNLDLVVKFAELEFENEGYNSAYSILVTAITASNSNFLKQSTEQGFLSATLLFRAAVELELREMVKIQKDNLEDPDLQKSDTIHRNRLQWLLVHIGCGKKFSAYTTDKSDLILALVEGALRSFNEWIMEDIQKISCSRIFEMAPFVRHSVGDVIFFHAWLTKFCSGTQDALCMVESVRNQINVDAEGGRFNQLELTKSFLVESLDKICLDMLWFDSIFDVIEKNRLRNFYHYCISHHSSSSYFQNMLVQVQDTTSIVSPIWQEVLNSIQNKKKTNLALIEEACEISLAKFLRVLDPNNPQDIPALGYCLLYKLSNLLERCVSKPFLKNNPLIWRLLLWCVSIESLRKDSKIGAENIKVMLYRAIQDVPWCKALYLDAALYLSRIGELTQTQKNIVHNSEDEDQQQEQKIEYIQGSMEHVNELMVEKEIRVRLPLQELEVLLEPL